MLSSKERLSLAINHEEPDYVPLSFRYISNNFLKERPWRDQFEKVEWELKLGLDPTLHLSHPQTWKLSHEVNVKIWKEITADERYPLLFKEYQTKRGTLRQIIRQTPDWPYGDFVPLWSDYGTPRARSKKYLIENMEDAEAFSQLFCEPTEKENEAFLKEAEQIKSFADEHGVLVVNEVVYGIGDAVAESLGIENMIIASFRNPSLIHKLLDILLEWSIKYLRQTLEADIVDVIWYNGASESFFSPKLYKTFIAPRVKKMIELAHKSGVKFSYGPRTPSIALFSLFKDMGVDIFWGPDPVQGNKDLSRIKQEVGDQICFWGGVNSYVTLGMGTRRQIGSEVTRAIRTLGPGGGLVLSVTDALEDHTPWRNIEHMMKIWRKMGGYPIR